MNRKGQALIEFVLILPILILILFTIVDFGNILNEKNQLEGTSTDIVRLILNGENKQEIEEKYKNIKINIDNEGDKYQKITVLKEINIVTPILNKIMNSPYKIKVERIIPIKNNSENEGESTNDAS